MITMWLWILAPLAAIHWLLWQRFRDGFRFQLVLDILLTVVVGPALLVGGALSTVRCLEDVPPYTGWRFSERTENQPTQSDLVRQIHPWMAETRRHLLAGRLPLISERIGGGQPLLANGQTGAWAPLNLPVWVLGPERGTTVMAVYKLEVAGLGAFLYLRRRRRLRPAAAGAGAAAFAGSAYLMAWLIVPMGWVIALAPWLWWGAEVIVAGRPRVHRLLGGGLLAGWLLGSGLNPETSAIVVGSAACAALVLRPRRCWRLAVVAATAAAVVAVLAWPTFGHIAASSRTETMAARSPNLEPPALTLRLQALQQLVVPMALGHPARGDWQGGYPYAAAAVGVGGLAVGLVAAGRVRRRHRRLLAAALASLAVAAVVGYRLPPLDALLVRLPPLDHMTLPRFVVLVPWSLALWAALAADGALHGLRRRRLATAAAVALVVTVAAVAAVRGLAPADLALVGVTIAAVASTPLLLRRSRWLAPVIAVELGLYAVGINPVAVAADLLPTPPLVARLMELEAKTGGRVIGLGAALPANLACRYGLSDLRAYDPLRPAPYAAMMAALGDRDPMLGSRVESAPPRLLGAWSVRFLISPPGVAAPGWEGVWSDDAGSIWSNPHWLPELRVVGRTVTADGAAAARLAVAESLDFAREAIVPPGTGAVSASRVELLAAKVGAARVRASVRCNGPCLVVLARPWSPGWRAVVDGAPAGLVRTNLAGLGAVSPAGEHVVELRYNPWLSR